MGSSHHLKRLNMPRSWALPRKTSVWVTRANAGPHALEMCMPLNVIVRDVLKFAKNSREVRSILHNGLVKVDGRLVRDARRGVGLMDVLTLGDINYRCLLDSNGKLRYHQIAPSDAEWKLCRIDGKSTLKGGKTQLNLHDGRCIIIDDAKAYSTGDSLQISLPDQQIMQHIPFEDGAPAYLIGGSHVGTVARIKEFIVKRSSMPNEVEFDDFGTVAQYVFIVGKDTPLPGLEVGA